MIRIVLKPLVTDVAVRLRKPARALTYLTLDNGQEFAHHERVSKTLGIDVYFADPYRSCQRGSNENANGLMRRYWPKGSCFRQLNAQAVRELMLRINRWPRKRLDYRSPFEVIYGGITGLHCNTTLFSTVINTRCYC